MSSNLLFITKKTNRPSEEKEANAGNINDEKNKIKKISEVRGIHSQNIEVKMETNNEKKDEMKTELEGKNDNKDFQKQENKDEKNIFSFSSIDKSEDEKIKSIDENTENSKNKDKKQTRKRIKERSKKDYFEFMNKMKSRKNKKDIFGEGYKSFLDSKYEWDLYLLNIILKIESNLQNFKDFNDDYTYYIYNNLRGLKTSKEYANLKNQPFDKKIFEESALFCEERFNRFIENAKSYNINKKDFYIIQHNQAKNIITNNPSNTNNTTNEISTNTQNNTNTQNIPNNPNHVDYKTEMLTASLVYNSLIRNEKEQEKFDKDTKKAIQEAKKENDKGFPAVTCPIKIEVLNFNLNEESMMAVLSGIKFNTNVTEINLSGNLLGPKSLFWLGGIFKTNPNIKILDLTRCGLDNDCLFMFVQGTKYSNKALNDEQLNLTRLNLKDNSQITDIINEKFEHPLGLILRRFKLTWLNLTNAKIKNKGTCQFLNTYLDLMKENKVYMENLILISNDFCNEKCLEILGDIIVQSNCTLKNLILSKNLISTSTSILPDQKNYFDYFMKKVTQSNIKELFLISCGIGKNMNDIQILYDMLCENKSLISLRLFGNEIKNMEDFSKILGIFSEYNNGLKNTSLKSLDLSKNSCNIKIDDAFLELVEKLKLEYLDINQNTMDPNEKETFRSRTNELNDIKIIY